MERSFYQWSLKNPIGLLLVMVRIKKWLFVTDFDQLLTFSAYIGPLSEIYEMMYKDDQEKEEMDFWYLDYSSFYLSIGKLHALRDPELRSRS